MRAETRRQQHRHGIKTWFVKKGICSLWDKLVPSLSIDGKTLV